MKRSRVDRASRRGHPISSGYKNIITTYLGGVALASGQHTNVYSTLNEYYGNNGTIRYLIKLGTPINDTSPLPPSGCKLSGQDRNGIYGHHYLTQEEFSNRDFAVTSLGCLQSE